MVSPVTVFRSATRLLLVVGLVAACSSSTGSEETTVTTVGPPAPWADKEAFCDAWGAFADLLGSFSDPRAALQEGSLIGELRRAVEETATDSMEDEVRDLLAALEAPLTVEGVPTLDVVVQG